MDEKFHLLCNREAASQTATTEESHVVMSSHFWQCNLFVQAGGGDDGVMGKEERARRHLRDGDTAWQRADGLVASSKNHSGSATRASFECSRADDAEA